MKIMHYLCVTKAKKMKATYTLKTKCGLKKELNHKIAQFCLDFVGAASKKASVTRTGYCVKEVAQILINNGFTKEELRLQWSTK